MIAPRFGDIFRNNATKVGLLPVVLPEDAVAALQDAVEADPPGRSPSTWSTARCRRGGRVSASFEIDDYTRWRLMEGLDDIGLTLRHADAITAFEHCRPSWLPVTA